MTAQTKSPTVVFIKDFWLKCFHAWDWASIFILSSETTQFNVSARGLYQEIIDKLIQLMGLFNKFLKIYSFINLKLVNLIPIICYNYKRSFRELLRITNKRQTSRVPASDG